MHDLTTEEIRALGHAVGLEIREPELTEVTYSLLIFPLYEFSEDSCGSPHRHP